MGLIIVVVICAIVAIAELPVMFALGRRANSSSAHIAMITLVFTLSFGPAAYCYALAETSHSRWQTIAAWGLGLVVAIVLVHALFSVRGVMKKILTVALGFIGGFVGVAIFSAIFGMPPNPPQ